MGNRFRLGLPVGPRGYFRLLRRELRFRLRRGRGGMRGRRVDDPDGGRAGRRRSGLFLRRRAESGAHPRAAGGQRVSAPEGYGGEPGLDRPPGDRIRGNPRRGGRGFSHGRGQCIVFSLPQDRICRGYGQAAGQSGQAEAGVPVCRQAALFQAFRHPRCVLLRGDQSAE